MLKLAFFEGLKNEQIALELGISINTVKTQKQRALQLLRLKLTDKTYLLLLFLLQW
jgi:RNA polymerase sigma-70 factor (ECF subfamily)